MGVVYRGEHRTQGIASRQGQVVLKTMHPHLATDPELRARFEREAEVLSRIDHPGVVKLIDLISDADTVALVMAHVPGSDLSEVADRWREPARLVALMEALAATLDHIHGLSIVHRDLKPSNIRVTPEGKPVLIDFGIARTEASGRTKTGTGLGTVFYMAPEQYVDAKRVDGRADVYALGLVAFRLLTGGLPWGEELSEFKVQLVKFEAELDLSAAGTAEQAFEHALAIAPEDRFGKAGAFVVALRSALLDEPESVARAPAPETPAPAPPPRVDAPASSSQASPSSKAPLLAVGGVGLGLGLVAAGGALMILVVVLAFFSRSSDEAPLRTEPRPPEISKSPSTPAGTPQAARANTGGGAAPMATKAAAAGFDSGDEAKGEAAAPASPKTAPHGDSGMGEAVQFDVALDVAFAGASLELEQIEDLGCRELVFVRNAAVARHGMDFQTDWIQSFYDSYAGYRLDPDVHSATIANYTSSVDRANIQLVLSVEVSQGCRR